MAGRSLQKIQMASSLEPLDDCYDSWLPDSQANHQTVRLSPYDSRGITDFLGLPTRFRDKLGPVPMLLKDFSFIVILLMYS